MNREQQLAEAFVDLTDTLARDVDPITLLRRLAGHSLVLTGMDAAGVLLANARGSLRPAAVSADDTALTELFQAQVVQGPGTEAFSDERIVHSADLGEHEATWPHFVRLARDEGYVTAYAMPLRVRHQTVGSLSLLARTPAVLSPSQLSVLQALADVAATAVVTWSSDFLRPTDIVTRTQAALSAKALLDTAAGMIAATADVPPREAAARLRVYAARSRQRPTDVADQLVRRRLAPESIQVEGS
ncbi:GAF and ANTAR domain-containing protein [Streptomyces sp. NPDC048560]|uniref:GAF and ANTAR domain-containing protein n=1 Tax=Streptomyces sp. NPDC048560 TaxID=3155488 RepID=UPI00343F4232